MNKDDSRGDSPQLNTCWSSLPSLRLPSHLRRFGGRGARGLCLATRSARRRILSEKGLPLRSKTSCCTDGPWRCRGQATIEAAVLLPSVMLLFAILLEPACLSYTRTIMRATACETARVAATDYDGDLDGPPAPGGGARGPTLSRGRKGRLAGRHRTRRARGQGGDQGPCEATSPDGRRRLCAWRVRRGRRRA